MRDQFQGGGLHPLARKPSAKMDGFASRLGLVSTSSGGTGRCRGNDMKYYEIYYDIIYNYTYYNRL